jgi:hypothetical protein
MLNVVRNYKTMQNEIQILDKLLKLITKYFILNFLSKNNKINNKIFKEWKVNFLNDDLNFYLFFDLGKSI